MDFTQTRIHAFKLNHFLCVFPSGLARTQESHSPPCRLQTSTQTVSKPYTQTRQKAVVLNVGGWSLMFGGMMCFFLSRYSEWEPDTVSLE